MNAIVYRYSIDSIAAGASICPVCASGLMQAVESDAVALAVCARTCKVALLGARRGGLSLLGHGDSAGAAIRHFMKGVREHYPGIPAAVLEDAILEEFLAIKPTPECRVLVLGTEPTGDPPPPDPPLASFPVKGAAAAVCVLCDKPRRPADGTGYSVQLPAGSKAVYLCRPCVRRLAREGKHSGTTNVREFMAQQLERDPARYLVSPAGEVRP
jgi:hypothetical protein